VTTTIQHDGKDTDVCVEIDPFGFVFLKAYRDDRCIAELPPMTPFEAGRIARDLVRAADMADRK
jgi:hypothetical protein